MERKEDAISIVTCVVKEAFKRQKSIVIISLPISISFIYKGRSNMTDLCWLNDGKGICMLLLSGQLRSLIGVA